MQITNNSSSHKLKKRIATTVTVVVVIAVLIVVRITFIGADEMTWTDYTEGDIERLTVFIEAFKGIHGNYPKSLKDFLNDPNFANNGSLAPMLNERSRTKYNYQSSSNGFSITAIRAGTLFSKQRIMQKSFKEGEAGILNAPFKVEQK